MFNKSLAELMDLFYRCNHNYHTGVNESELSDHDFDMLKIEVLRRDSQSPIKNLVGTHSPDAVPLPFAMGSLTNIWEAEFTGFFYPTLNPATPFILSDKMDGISLQLVYKNGFLVNAFTRYDGTSGKDVTRHALLIPSIPTHIMEKEDMVLRAEAFIPNSVFDKKYLKAKELGFGTKNYKTARNLTAGIFNRKEPTLNQLQDIQVVVFSLLHESATKFHKFHQLTLAESLGFSIVHYSSLAKKEITAELLTVLLQERRKTADYGIDGLVVECDNPELRKKLGYERNTHNPKFAKAFKSVELEEKVVATVKRVVWKTSKDGYIKPTVEMEPIILGGVTVSRATAYNAKFIVDNKLGQNATVLIVRSGMVIPKILKVLAPAKRTSMPGKKEFGEYHWNKTNVDLVTVSQGDAEKLQKLVHFFTTLGTNNFSVGLITAFYENGYTSLAEILSLSKEDMIDYIPKVQGKKADAILLGIKESLTDIYLPSLMDASGIFGRGFGTAVAELIYNTYGDDLFYWSGWSKKKIIDDVQAIDGLGEERASQFYEGLAPFKKWLKAHSKFFTISSYEVEVVGPLTGTSFVFSGFRDKLLHSRIEEKGGEVKSSITKNSTFLVVKSKEGKLSKISKAHEYGIKVINPEELEKMLKQTSSNSKGN